MKRIATCCKVRVNIRYSRDGETRKLTFSQTRVERSEAKDVKWGFTNSEGHERPDGVTLTLKRTKREKVEERKIVLPIRQGSSDGRANSQPNTSFETKFEPGKFCYIQDEASSRESSD